MKTPKKVTVNWSKLKKRLERTFRIPRKQAKDIVFRLIFGEDKKALLELCNALHGTGYTNPNDIQIVTLGNALYIQMKNDVAFVIAGCINLYEHQSTINPNMPLRFFIYLAEEYQALIENIDKSIYASVLISIPTPQCVVFYNGVEPMEDERILRLSDAFQNQDVEASAELIVRMININRGHNEKLMAACGMLEQYSLFVEILREFNRQISDTREAMNQAIDYCIEHGILEEILRKNRGEILGSLLETFDKEKYEKTIREESFESGYSSGKEDGRKEIIYNMLLFHQTDEQIITMTKCTKEEIEAIRREM